MNQKKKIIGAIAAIAIVAVIVLGINQFMPKKEAGNKEITITVIDKMNGNKQLYEETIRTDTETLYALLAERKDLKAIFEDSTYGHYLTSLVDIAQGDATKGPWWLYSSTNNEACVSAGMCPGVDELVIKDKDVFEFVYTNTFE